MFFLLFLDRGKFCVLLLHGNFVGENAGVFGFLFQSFASFDSFKSFYTCKKLEILDSKKVFVFSEKILPRSFGFKKRWKDSNGPIWMNFRRKSGTFDLNISYFWHLKGLIRNLSYFSRVFEISWSSQFWIFFYIKLEHHFQNNFEQNFHIWSLYLHFVGFILIFEVFMHSSFDIYFKEDLKSFWASSTGKKRLFDLSTLVT